MLWIDKEFYTPSVCLRDVERFSDILPSWVWFFLNGLGGHSPFIKAYQSQLAPSLHPTSKRAGWNVSMMENYVVQSG